MDDTGHVKSVFDDATEVFERKGFRAVNPIRNEFDRFREEVCMIAFESTGWTRRCLLGGLLALMVGATSAGAEVLVPFTPGNLLKPSVQVTVTNADGLYTYAYAITLDGSDPAKQQKAGNFVLELHGDVSNVTTPRGWHFMQYRTKPLFSWGCIEPEPLKPGEVDDGNMPPCRYSIAPGSTLAGFSFRSIHPPGNVSFMIQGEKKWPVATDEDDDLGPGADPDVRVDSVSGETTGPVPVQICSGPDTDGAVCDDGYFCNGPDTCLSGRCIPRANNPCTGKVFCKGADTCSNGSCIPHAGNPCTEEEDGDDDCAEACDEDHNNCSRYDRAGSPCLEDGNPCTRDYCSRGDCIHTPGNAGAVCGAPPSDGYSERTCTGASIVCPSSSIALDELNRLRLLSEKQKNDQIASMLKQEQDALERIRAATFENTSDDNRLVVDMAKGLKDAGDRRGMDLINDYFAAVDGNRNPGTSDQEHARIFRDVKLYNWIGMSASDEIAPAMLEGLRKLGFHSSVSRTGCSFFDMRWPNRPRLFDAKYAEAMLVAIDGRGPYGAPPAGSEDFCAEAFKSQLANPDVHQAFFKDVYPQLTPGQKELADKLSKEPPEPLR